MISSLTQCKSHIIIYQFQLSKFKKGIRKLSNCNRLWLFLCCDHFRDVPWEDIFKLSASAPGKFCEWVHIGIDVYIPHHKYQVKPHSSPWFSAVFAAAIVYWNHLFYLYQQNKSSESKVRFRQSNNCCQRIIDAAKLAYANKTSLIVEM